MFLVGSVKYMCICGSERRQYHEVWILHLSLHRLRREGRGEGGRKGGREEEGERERKGGKGEIGGGGGG